MNVKFLKWSDCEYAFAIRDSFREEGDSCNVAIVGSDLVLVIANAKRPDESSAVLDTETASDLLNSRHGLIVHHYNH